MNPSTLGILFAVYLVVAVFAAYLLLGKAPPEISPQAGGAGNNGEKAAVPKDADELTPVVEAELSMHPLEPTPVPEKRELAVRGQVSLSTGGGLDFRRIDPASVEIRADQMLAPLRYVSEVLSELKGAGEETELGLKSGASAEVAEAKLRQLIAQIEDIDLMLQVSDGHINVQNTRFQLKEVVCGIVMKAAKSAEKAGGNVRWVDREEVDDAYLVEMDRHLLQRVVSQLINSAYRANQDGPVEVVFNSESPRRSARRVDLFAETTGDFRRKIFVEVRFHRPETSEDTLQLVVAGLTQNRVEELVEKHLVDPSPDSDLFGLSLVRELVNRMGGELSYENFEGQRASFILSFEAETIPVS